MKRFILSFLAMLSVSVFCQENIPDTINVSERIQTIQNMLDNSKKKVDVWNYGWIGAYSVATISQGVIGLANRNLNVRQDMALGAATTLLGAAFQTVNPLNISKNAASLAQMPDSTSADKILKLMAAEEYLREISQKEIEGRSWKIQTLNATVNIGSGLVTWLAFKRSVWDGVGVFLLNTAVSELQIFTQPMRSAKDYKYYDEKYKHNNVTAMRKATQTEFLVGATSSGISLTIKF